MAPTEAAPAGTRREVINHPEQPLVVSGGADGSVAVTDVTEPKAPKAAHALEAHKGAVTSVALHAAKALVAAQDARQAWHAASSRTACRAA